jgi:glutamate N-acetyltransferase/amino-acid N-acetyltransferase
MAAVGGRFQTPDHLFLGERGPMSAIIPCPGFTAAGTAAGVKKNGSKDLGLIVSDPPAAAAGVFTRNRVQAAPVRLCRERIRGGLCRAVVVNSGNANCLTGEAGDRHARRMAQAAAAALGAAAEQVLVASTGVIGEPLPIERIEAALPALVRRLSPEGIADFAEAIMTTDRVPKVVSRQGRVDGRGFTVTGVVKGAGMIRPDVATMLAFILTDVQAAAPALKELLAAAADRSFNRITVDGDTSTNDTVLLLANGRAAVDIAAAPARAEFGRVLEEVALALAKWVVKDSEGATKLVEVVVRGAPDAAGARKVAEAVAHSPLVKTALFGEDANWGRVLAAAGRAGVDFDPGRAELFFGPVKLFAGGAGCGPEAEAAAAQVLKRAEFDITIDLNAGPASDSVFTCDFSLEYVKINADYRS